MKKTWTEHCIQKLIHTVSMSSYKTGCILFNTTFMTLHDRMRKDELGYEFVDFHNLAWKLWALESDLGGGGAMQSFQCNDIMAYNTKEEDDVLSKQAEFLCELYGRWKTKQEMGKWRTEWREWHYPFMVVSITSMRNPNSYPCILTNSNLFQPNAEVSTGCPNDAAMCKSFFCVWKKQRRIQNPVINLKWNFFRNYLLCK